MKKRQLKLLALSSLMLGIGLTSCGTTPVETSTLPAEEPTVSTTETIVTSEDVVPTTEETPTSTEETPTTEETPINKDQRFNTIAKSMSLDAEYEGKTFLEDGIEEITLNQATDGDTASFTTKNSNFSFTARFYAIDTPESTGSVEKWGKNASKYTASVLQSAYALLAESSILKVDYTGVTDYEPPVDSYGVRRLAYIWYKETADSEWVNLNLEIVENGYSDNKCDVDSPYYSYFTNAYRFAKKNELHIHGDDLDPYYSEAAKEVTVKELALNANAYYNSADQTGDKVHFTGFIESVDKSSTGTYMYHVADFDENGEKYTFNVYAGYASTGIPDYMRIGNYFSLTGSLQLYNGKFQVSGLTYVPLETGVEYINCIQEMYQLTFDSNISWTQLYGTNTLYKDATVVSAKIVDNTLIIEASALNSYQKDKKKKNVTYNFTCKCTVDNTVVASDLIGKSFTVTGYQFVDNSNIITVKNYSNFTWK